MSVVALIQWILEGLKAPTGNAGGEAGAGGPGLSVIGNRHLNTLRSHSGQVAL